MAGAAAIVPHRGDTSRWLATGTRPLGEVRLSLIFGCFHRHAGEAVRFYVYRDAATLLAEFWKQVDSILEKRSKQS